MMPRRHSDTIDQHEYSQTNNPSSPFHNPTYNRNARVFGGMNQASTVMYHNSQAGFQQSDLTNDPRRYGISVAPNSVPGGLMQFDQSQHHMGGMITNTQSQYPLTYRPSEFSQFQNTGTSSMYVSADGQRISQMGPGGMQMAVPTNSQYAYSLGVDMQQDQIQQQQQPVQPSLVGNSTQSTLISQAEREEELLLQLLIARRNRSHQSGVGTNDSLADELMRLRQSRGFNSPSFPGGSTMNQSVMDSSTIGGMQRQFLPELNGRIDRNPTRLVDARTQDMMDLSQRGKRPVYDVKYGQIDQIFMGQDMDGMPQKRQKRAHRKKPADMPRRPLSAYNLFFSEERERILKEIESKEDGTKGDEEDETEHTTDKKSGEDQSEADGSEKKSEDDNDTSSASKPIAFLRPLIPTEKKRRPHRKTHGKISFQTLARMVGERWKNLPIERLKYYQDLAEEDAKRQKVAMDEYYARQKLRNKEGDETSKETVVKEGGDDETKEVQSVSSTNPPHDDKRSVV